MIERGISRSFIWHFWVIRTWISIILNDLISDFNAFSKPCWQHRWCDYLAVWWMSRLRFSNKNNPTDGVIDRGKMITSLSVGVRRLVRVKAARRRENAHPLQDTSVLRSLNTWFMTFTSQFCGCSNNFFPNVFNFFFFHCRCAHDEIIQSRWAANWFTHTFCLDSSHCKPFYINTLVVPNINFNFF